MSTSPLEMLPDSTPETPTALPADLESRRHQMFPTLSDADIKHMLRFGHVRHFSDGEKIAEAGKSSYGMLLVLKGGVAISRFDGLGNTSYITCLLYTSPSPRDATLSRMPSSA